MVTAHCSSQCVGSRTLYFPAAMTHDDESGTTSEALRRALEAQSDPDSHDRGLIVERLSWSPEERLHANTAFIRLLLTVRPDGPLVREE